MTRKQSNRLAKLYAANVLYNALGNGAHSDLMSNYEHDVFCEKVKSIAIKLAKSLSGGVESLQLGTLDDLVAYSKMTA
jgi:hypothetical protein